MGDSSLIVCICVYNPLFGTIMEGNCCDKMSEINVLYVLLVTELLEWFAGLSL